MNARGEALSSRCGGTVFHVVTSHGYAAGVEIFAHQSQFL